MRQEPNEFAQEMRGGIDGNQNTTDKRRDNQTGRQRVIGKSFRHHTNCVVIMEFQKGTGKGVSFEIGLETVG